MADPVVSVVMSVFNAEHYVAEAIESVLNQSTRNIEFIIIDDGSTDGSTEIIESFAERDERIKFVRQGNSGLSAALNKGIALSCGKWIARMDADDVALPERLERQLAWLEHTGDDMCGCFVQVIGSMRKRIWRYPVTRESIAIQLLFNSAFAHPTVVVKANVLKSYPYVNNDLPGQDYDLWTRMLMDGVRMSNCPEVLLKYRQHGKQVSIEKQETQFKSRNSISRDYWGKRGLQFPLNTIIKFTNVAEIKKLLSVLAGNASGPAEKEIITDAIWKMAMRSGDLGLALYQEFIQNGVNFRLTQKLMLFFVCLTQQGPGNRIFDYFYGIR